jgi:hypothetical protein
MLDVKRTGKRAINTLLSIGIVPPEYVKIEKCWDEKNTTPLLETQL